MVFLLKRFSNLKNKFTSSRITFPLWPVLLFISCFSYKLFFLFTHLTFIEVMSYPLSKVIGYIVINDLSFLSTIILVYLLCPKKRHFYLTLPVLALCILYFADIELYQSLYRRLTFINLYKYIDESKAVYSFVSLRKIFLFAIILLIIWYTRRFTVTLYKRKLVFISGILLVAFIPWLSLFFRPFDPFLDMVTSNVLQINQRVVINRGIRVGSYLRMRELFPLLTRKFDALSFNRPHVDISTDEHKT